MKTIEIEITELQCTILTSLNDDATMCYGYWTLEDATGKTRKELKKEVTFLRMIGLVEYWKGCMNDDGQTTGSGFCRSSEGNDFVEKYNL